MSNCSYIIKFLWRYLLFDWRFLLCLLLRYVLVYPFKCTFDSISRFRWHFEYLDLFSTVNRVKPDSRIYLVESDELLVISLVQKEQDRQIHQVSWIVLVIKSIYGFSHFIESWGVGAINHEDESIALRKVFIPYLSKDRLATNVPKGEFCVSLLDFR